MRRNHKQVSHRSGINRMDKAKSSKKFEVGDKVELIEAVTPINKRNALKKGLRAKVDKVDGKHSLTILYN